MEVKYCVEEPQKIKKNKSTSLTHCILIQKHLQTSKFRNPAALAVNLNFIQLNSKTSQATIIKIENILLPQFKKKKYVGLFYPPKPNSFLIFYLPRKKEKVCTL